ncbi:MAG: hypothetical protein ACLPWF_19680 [Bryobacteraceae bacterium]
MRGIPFLLLSATLACAQTHQPFQSQSPAGVVYSVSSDGLETVEITNVAFQVANHQHSLLLLRTTTRTKEAINEIGMEASTTVEAWPVGVDLKQKPVYTLKTDGMDCRTVDDSLLVILRGVEEVPWWSVYKLETGQRLFDTYVPLLGFSIRRDILTMRYVGLEVPEDNASDKRLNDPHVVGVLTYASAERVLREALITSDDPKQAQMLRSFADASRSGTLVETPARGLKISISQNYPSAPATVTITVPIVKDDLDLVHAQLPAHLHVAVFKN